MTTACIVQARLRSTRLPGKVMLCLDGHTVLWHVLTRCRAIPGVDTVCCAVPDTEDSAPLIVEALGCEAVVVRGPEHDVLARYELAASMLHADTIVRVTSDCPLIDPDLCGRVLALLKAERVDYACNNMPRTFPHGLDCEAFTRAALTRAYEEAVEPEHREHVTGYMRERMRTANLMGPGDGHIRLTLDTIDDYATLAKVFNA